MTDPKAITSRPPIPNTPSNVLVTGATGFIGSRITLRLARQGHTVIATARNGPAVNNLSGTAHESPPPAAAAFEECDLHDHGDVEHLIGRLAPEACVHAAWDVTPGSYKSSTDNGRWIASSLNLFTQLADHGCRWICGIGTCFETAQSPEAECAYTRAKSALRASAAQLLSRYPDTRLCWLRVFQPFGAGEHPDRLLPSLISACVAHRSFVIRTGNAIRDFIHTDDIARAVCLALEHRLQGAFDVGSGRGRSVQDIATWIANLARHADSIDVLPSVGDAESDRIVADPDPLTRATGWTASIPLESTVRISIGEAMAAIDSDHVHTRGCPVCGGSSNSPLLEAVDQPVMLNRLYHSAPEALASPRVPLAFRQCRTCGFVFNACFEPSTVRYSSDYVNDQAHSKVYLEHSHSVRDRLVELVRSRPGRIVEIGCGQGGFLSSLCERARRQGIGFDPAYLATSPSPPSITLISESFGEDSVERLSNDASPIALICCRHVIEHLDDPVRMLNLIEQLAGPHDALVYLETPCYDWIRRRAAFFDLFNEHCSLFTASSMCYALNASHMHATTIRTAFGGQYLCAEISPGILATNETAAPDESGDTGPAAASFVQHRAAVAESLNEAAACGPIVAWGAAGKGVSLAAHIGLDSHRAPFFVDINPEKHHRFVPVTGQCVIAPSQLPEALAAYDRPPHILVTNPNYSGEISNALASLAVEASLIVLTDRNLHHASD